MQFFPAIHKNKFPQIKIITNISPEHLPQTFFPEKIYSTQKYSTKKSCLFKWTNRLIFFKNVTVKKCKIVWILRTLRNCLFSCEALVFGFFSFTLLHCYDFNVVSVSDVLFVVINWVNRKLHAATINFYYCLCLWKVKLSFGHFYMCFSYWSFIV